MELLVLALLAALGISVYELKKKSSPSTKALPGGVQQPPQPPLPPNATPEQQIQNEAPALAKEIVDLLQNGRNPDLMDQLANELEKEGFFDSAALLHKQAATLRAQGTVQPGSPQSPFPPGRFSPQSPFGAAPGAASVPNVPQGSRFGQV